MTNVDLPLASRRVRSQCVVVLSMMLVSGSLSARAAEIVVTSTADTVGGPECTLRDAISAANLDSAVGGCSAGQGADTIVLASSANYLLTEADHVTLEDGDFSQPAGVPQPIGLPMTTSDITILGNGSTVARSGTRGTPAFRLLEVAAGSHLAVQSLTLTGGRAPGVLDESGNFYSGGHGGAIRNAGTTTFTDVTAVWNSADGVGGSIYNVSGASLRLIDSAIKGNLTGSTLGADGPQSGGGIFNAGELTLIRTAVTRNQTGEGGDGPGGYGGGISNIGTATLIDSSVADNATGGGGFGGAGGGIFNFGALTLVRCTVSGNTAGGGDAYGNGGGIANGDGVPDPSMPLSGGTVALIDSTVSGNQAGVSGEVGGSGGGIFNAGMLTLASATVAGNLAGAGGAENGSGGGIATAGAGVTIVRNSLIVGNSSAALSDPGDFGTSFLGPDCFGAFSSEGYNLLEDPSACTVSGDTTGNRFGQHPQLGPLQDNGGPTQTRALLAGSPAIDAGNPGGCIGIDGALLTIDQRGAPRMVPGDARCDIGAYEASRPAYPTITATPTATPTITATPSLTPTRTLRPLPTPNGCGPETACLLIGTAIGPPNARVTIPITVLPNGRSIAGTQNDVGFSPAAGIAALANGDPDCAVNPGIDKEATAFAFVPHGCVPGVDCRAVRAIVLSFKQSDAILSPTVLYECAVHVSETAMPGRYVLTGLNAAASAPGGAVQHLLAGNGYVLVTASSASDPSGGCSVTPHPGSGAAGVLLVAVALAWMRRRRRTAALLPS